MVKPNEIAQLKPKYLFLMAISVKALQLKFFFSSS